MNTIPKISAVAVIAFAAIAAQAAVSDEPSHSPMHHHQMMRGSPFVMAIHQLGLSDAQRQSIHSIMENAHTQTQTDVANKHDQTLTLMNPGDPNYAAAVKAAEATAVARIEQRSQIDTQIYNQLTPEQQQKLPQLLADMKNHMQRHQGEWHHRGNPRANAPTQ